MGNVTLPTPVFIAGGALCVVAGMLIGGVVLSPGTPERTTGKVVSYDPGRSRLCLEGDGIKDQEGVDSSGHLCGTLRRTANSKDPAQSAIYCNLRGDCGLKMPLSRDPASAL